jgi:hypothetical protein
LLVSITTIELLRPPFPAVPGVFTRSLLPELVDL